MNLLTVRVLCAVLPFVLSTTTAAQTAAADTMTRIRESHSITLGVREAARPFSFMNEQRQAVGYSVDLCLAAVDEIKRELKLADLTIRYKYVSGAERIPKLLANEIDLECGSTTNTKARQEKVRFSYTVFVAGMRVLMKKDAKVESVKDLNGLSVALSKGTTSEKLFTQLNGGEVNMQLQTFASNTDAYKALKAGKVQAFPQDDSLLLGLAAADKALDALAVSAFALSVEPYAIMMRKGDAALASAVDRSLLRLYSSGDILAIYKKWFATDTLTIPMGRLTRDGFIRPNREPGVALLLGYSI